MANGDTSRLGLGHSYLSKFVYSPCSTATSMMFLRPTRRTGHRRVTIDTLISMHIISSRLFVLSAQVRGTDISVSLSPASAASSSPIAQPLARPNPSTFLRKLSMNLCCIQINTPIFVLKGNAWDGS